MKTMDSPILFCLIVTFFLSPTTLDAQGIQTKEVLNDIYMVNHPEFGNQIVVRSETGLLVFDSFWSGRAARIFKEEISKSLNRGDFSYVINMVDRLDMIGGNAAFQDAVIVGHENVLYKYRNEEAVQAEKSDLVEMWREKEGYSMDRLKNMEKGSDEERLEQGWMNKCKNMADELEQEFLLVLPQITYNDRLMLDLGDISVHLYWFGETGNYRGLTLAMIPEKKLAVLSKSILFPSHHLAPYPMPDYGVLDVPRWIALLEEIVEGENAFSHIMLSDYNQLISKDLLKSHLEYIRKLWNRVNALADEGRNLQEIQELLTLENEFAFVKEMQLYKERGDWWIRPQHQLHIKHFFLQGKDLASEVLKDGGVESLQASMEKISQERSTLYFDEEFINRIGVVWMSMGYNLEAIEVFKLNAENFPRSSAVYANLAEAYMNLGERDRALKYYERSHELNPGNESVNQALIELRKQSL